MWICEHSNKLSSLTEIFTNSSFFYQVPVISNDGMRYYIEMMNWTSISLLSRDIMNPLIRQGIPKIVNNVECDINTVAIEKVYNSWKNVSYQNTILTQSINLQNNTEESYSILLPFNLLYMSMTFGKVIGGGTNTIPRYFVP